MLQNAGGRRLDALEQHLELLGARRVERLDGEVEPLRGASPPLGICSDLRFVSCETRLREGAQLVLYTDGVTEVNRDAIAGEERLTKLMRDEAFPHAANPARFIERTLVGEHPRDDVAIMTLRIGARNRHWRFDVGDSTAAYATGANSST